jgi:hypothetical protein
MNNWKTEYDVKCKQYTISIERPKKKLKGKICVKATQIRWFLEQSDGEARQYERWP